MSRIHEALKKAAQERSSHLAAGTLPDLADVAPGFESPSGLGTQVGEPAARTARTSDGSSFLCFDDLLKRCAHPSWRLDQLFGAPSGPGLADYLRGEADEFGVIQNGLEGNLCFIPGGSDVSNPSELLLGDRMKKLLDLVTPVFDWIILDSPPALAVHDASSLADLCDGVLFVVKAGKTDYQSAEKASSEFLGKNLLGVVLNGVEKGVTYDRYYSGYMSDDREDVDRK